MKTQIKNSIASQQVEKQVSPAASTWCRLETGDYTDDVSTFTRESALGGGIVASVQREVWSRNIEC